MSTYAHGIFPGVFCGYSALPETYVVGFVICLRAFNHFNLKCCSIFDSFIFESFIFFVFPPVLLCVDFGFCAVGGA